MSKIKENAIGIAVPTGHETVFFEPVVVRSLSSGINLGRAFFGRHSVFGWTLCLGGHCQVNLNDQHYEVLAKYSNISTLFSVFEALR